MALRIRIEHGQDAGKTLRLASPGVYRFGRGPRSSAQILDMKVSKEHFDIVVGGSGARLRDLGSSHGTLLNAQIVPAQGKPLEPGDEIRVGLTVIRALSDGPADEEIQPFEGDGAGPSAAEASHVDAPRAIGRPVAKALPPDALVGTVLSGYRILEKVGAGGMGSVYRAEQLSLHREVALKVLAEKLVSDSAFVDQFVNEARAAGQLNHPNVVQVYDVGQAEGRHFFSMEFIHGGSVEGKIPKDGGGVPWQDALSWFLDAANALIFAEQKGILHRDIKPDNFMVGQEGSVKLCDLGLAKKSESADLLAQGIIGTPHFIAPEAIRRRSDVDRRADLYSLGCTFFRVLTGKNPYPGSTVKEILLAHLNAPIPRASALASDVPKDLDEIIARLMAKDPAARFQNAEDLWDALERVRLQFGLEAHGLHPGRTRTLLIAAIALLVVGGGAVVAMKPWEQPAPEPKQDVVYVKSPADKELERLARETAASAAFQSMRNDLYERLGKPDEGDAWKQEKEWQAAADGFRALADDERYARTPAATEAREFGAEIDERASKYRTAVVANQDAIHAAEREFDATNGKAIAEIRAALDAKQWPAAVAKADAVVEANRRAAEKRAPDGTALLQKERVERANARLVDLRRSAAEALGVEVAALRKAGRDGIDKATTPEAFAAVDEELSRWLAARPAPATDATDELSKTISQTRDAVDALREEISRRVGAWQREALLEDRAAVFALLRRLYQPIDDAGQGGAVAGLRFQDAVTQVKALVPRSEAYKPRLTALLKELTLVAALPDFLAARAKDRGFKDPITGRGWNGTPKEFTPTGVLVGDKLHLYADEGPGWFVDLFFEKSGAERFPLGPDEREGLAAVSEAAGIVEVDGGRRFDLAVLQLSKAASEDPARAARLDARRREVEAEKEARDLLSESDKAVELAQKEMSESYERLVASLTDAKKHEAARKAVQASEAAWRKSLDDAKRALHDAISKHPASVVRALLEPKVPADAAYAGETLPDAPPAPAPAPAPPPVPK